MWGKWLLSVTYSAWATTVLNSCLSSHLLCNTLYHHYAVSWLGWCCWTLMAWGLPPKVLTGAVRYNHSGLQRSDVAEILQWLLSQPQVDRCRHREHDYHSTTWPKKSFRGWKVNDCCEAEKCECLGSRHIIIMFTNWGGVGSNSYCGSTTITLARKWRKRVVLTVVSTLLLKSQERYILTRHTGLCTRTRWPPRHMLSLLPTKWRWMPGMRSCVSQCCYSPSRLWLSC